MPSTSSSSGSSRWSSPLRVCLAASLLAGVARAQVWEFEVDSAQSQLVVSGHVFGQFLNCAGTPVSSVIDLGPIQECPSGDLEIPLVIQQGSLWIQILPVSKTGSVRARIVDSDLLSGGLLLSLRGDDFRLTLGQDFSVGYEAHDGRKLRLFLTESFTFHAMEPRAVVRFTERAT